MVVGPGHDHFWNFLGGTQKTLDELMGQKGSLGKGAKEKAKVTGA